MQERMWPWLVDNHDETIWEAKEEHAQAAADVIDEGLKRANAELGMEIQLKAPTQIADNLAAIKSKDYDKWLKSREAV